MTLDVAGPTPGPFRWSIVVPETRITLDLHAEIVSTLAALDRGPVQLWIRDVDEKANAVATALGFRQYRDLWQLRCPLPNEPSGLATSAYTPGDLGEFIGVNNRAFHWHPEQGGLTPEAVEATMTEPWFDPEGFRLYRDGGALVGFCWTKVHRDIEPNLGEIYVIAIDPSRHGQGLGRPMTLAGLEWLAEQGLEHGMLYVESDNHPANATYAAIGFSRHHTDRAYELEWP